MRCFISLSLIFSLTASAQDITGNWNIDKHLMILNDDGTFYASGYEPMDDQYGTYQVTNDEIYFTYNMYNGLVKSSYKFAIDDEGTLLLFDELGYTYEYVRAE